MTDDTTKAKDEAFPILGGPYPGLPRSVPWRLLAPQERQARDNHDQSLKHLAERGGLSPAEMMAVLRGERWSKRTFVNDELAAIELSRILKADADDESYARGMKDGRAERDAELRRPEVVERVARAIHEARYLEACEIQGMPYPEWDSLPEHERDDYRAEATAALAAAVGGTKP